jgi:O-methyltransferase
VSLIKGYFNKTCDGIAPKTYGIDKALIVMIDCDTLVAAKSCFDFCTPLIQEGTIFILDDYFSYKGSQQKGVTKAFEDWKTQVGQYNFRKVSDYGMGGAMFIAGLR